MAEGLTEVVAEMAEEVAEQAETVAKVSRALTGRDMSLVFFGSTVGVVGGCVIGYFYAKSRLSAKFDEILADEIELMREHFKTKTEATMGRITKPDLDEVVTKLGYIPGTTERQTPHALEEEAAVEIVPAAPINIKALTEDAEVVSGRGKNVFDRPHVATAPTEPEPTDVWDYAAEVKSRNPAEPYIIHVDEFTANEKGYTQSTLTFYEDDDVLADERDNVIEDQEEMVGIQNLVRFGHGSNDANTVHIRNDKRHLDLEVLRSSGSYAEEVHGFKHMDEPDRRRRGWVE